MLHNQVKPIKPETKKVAYVTIVSYEQVVVDFDDLGLKNPSQATIVDCAVGMRSGGGIIIETTYDGTERVPRG